MSGLVSAVRKLSTLAARAALMAGVLVALRSTGFA